MWWLIGIGAWISTILIICLFIHGASRRGKEMEAKHEKGGSDEIKAAEAGAF